MDIETRATPTSIPSEIVRSQVVWLWALEIESQELNNKDSNNVLDAGSM